jgi:hypothetical protein
MAGIEATFVIKMLVAALFVVLVFAVAVGHILGATVAFCGLVLGLRLHRREEARRLHGVRRRRRRYQR